MGRKIFVLSACFSIRMGWKAIDLMLSESTRKKITLTGDNTDKELKSMTNPSNLFKKYGGEVENLESFWPPQMPS